MLAVAAEAETCFGRVNLTGMEALSAFHAQCSRFGIWMGIGPLCPDEFCILKIVHLDRIIDQHRQFVAFIEARDADAAETLGGAHAELARRRVVDAMAQVSRR